MSQPLLYVLGVPAGLKELGGVGMAQASHCNVYTGTLANCLQAVSEQSKVWLTRDCGENWTAHSLDWTVQALAFDPQNADILLVGTRESGAFKIHLP